MKRLLIVAMVLSAFGAVGAAHAGCTAANRGGSAGPYDTAGVAYGNLEVKAWTYGNFATGPTSLCSDGTTATDAPHGNFEVKRNGGSRALDIEVPDNQQQDEARTALKPTLPNTAPPAPNYPPILESRCRRSSPGRT